MMFRRPVFNQISCIILRHVLGTTFLAIQFRKGRIIDFIIKNQKCKCTNKPNKEIQGNKQARALSFSCIRISFLSFEKIEQNDTMLYVVVD